MRAKRKAEAEGRLIKRLATSARTGTWFLVFFLIFILATDSVILDHRAQGCLEFKKRSVYLFCCIFFFTFFTSLNTKNTNPFAMNLVRE